MKKYLFLIIWVFCSFSLLSQTDFEQLIQNVENCKINQSSKQPLIDFLVFYQSVNREADTTSAVVDTTAVDSGPRLDDKQQRELKNIRKRMSASLIDAQKSAEPEKSYTLVIVNIMLATLDNLLNDSKSAIASNEAALKNLKGNKIDFCGSFEWTRSDIHRWLFGDYKKLKNYAAAKKNLQLAEQYNEFNNTESQLVFVNLTKNLASETNNSQTLLEAAKKLDKIGFATGADLNRISDCYYLFSEKLPKPALIQYFNSLQGLLNKDYGGFTSSYGETENDLSDLKIMVNCRLFDLYRDQKDYLNSYFQATYAFREKPCKQYLDAAKTYYVLSTMKEQGWLPCGGDDFIVSSGNPQTWYFYHPSRLVKRGNYVETWQKSIEIDFDVTTWIFSFMDRSNDYSSSTSTEFSVGKNSVVKASIQKYPQAIKWLSWTEYDYYGNVENSGKAGPYDTYSETVPGSIGEALWKFYFGVK